MHSGDPARKKVSYGRRLLVGIDSLAFWRSRRFFFGIVVDVWLELMLSFAFWMASYCRRFLIGFDALACIVDVLEGLLKTMSLKVIFENDVLEDLFENDVLE